MQAEERLDEFWAEIRDLQSAEELLEWDQETYMPADGQTSRGQVLATLAGIRHSKLVATEFQDSIAACHEAAMSGGELEAKVREGQRQMERALKVPRDLIMALAKASSAGLAAWQEAKKADDFCLFRSHLEHLVELKQEEAAALSQRGPKVSSHEPRTAYDTLLDLHEPGMTSALLSPLFSALQGALTPLVRSVVDGGAVIDESPCRGHFPVDRQLEFGRWVGERIGFDFRRGRADRSLHPFCIGVSRDDVRITWWSHESDFRPTLFALLHEVGHGLYEQGLPERWERTPLGSAASLGVHESQSRLWENHVGRSRGFWQGALQHFQATFPQCKELTLERLWPALHVIRPSLIRVEADEVTYNLHVMARFELERDLMEGSLQVRDLPGAWAETYDRLLGLRPENDAQGVLQDIHWAMGLFGYFPTYTLGTLLAAQLFASAERELGELGPAFAEGEFEPLLDWLRLKVHANGCRLTPSELIEGATGSPLDAGPFIAHVSASAQELYSASAI